ncbi:hypothetical protein MMC10_008100 [Thelotrema lepadinum]|nr:hypothetical protein [Thelotrema lepadinum]
MSTRNTKSLAQFSVAHYPPLPVDYTFLKLRDRLELYALLLVDERLAYILYLKQSIIREVPRCDLLESSQYIRSLLALDLVLRSKSGRRLNSAHLIRKIWRKGAQKTVSHTGELGGIGGHQKDQDRP